MNGSFGLNDVKGRVTKLLADRKQVRKELYDLRVELRDLGSMVDLLEKEEHVLTSQAVHLALTEVEDPSRFKQWIMELDNVRWHITKSREDISIEESVGVIRL